MLERRLRRARLIASADLPGAAVASLDDVRHRAHLREGDPWMRHAYMNAAPSMLSTCGSKRRTTSAIDRALPWTVFTVMPRTAGSLPSAGILRGRGIHQRAAGERQLVVAEQTELAES